MRLCQTILAGFNEICLMKFGFFDNGIGYRGTTRAMISYASQLAREHEVIIYFVKGLPTNKYGICSDILKRGILPEPINNRDELLNKKLDILYHVTSSGSESNKWLEKVNCVTLLHQVGYHPEEVHPGVKFAYTSAWQSAYFSGGRADVLPYIIEEPKVLINKKEARKYLDIPEDSIVISRHGGLDTWNIPFASRVVTKIAKERSDIQFIFLNTPVFTHSKNIHFFNGTHDQRFLEIFLAASDAMIHARWEGETFGLACAEFLIRSKPIITWSQSREKNHILLADSSALLYQDEFQLEYILKNCTKEYLQVRAEQIPLELLRSNYSCNTIMQRFHSLLC